MHELNWTELDVDAITCKAATLTITSLYNSYNFLIKSYFFYLTCATLMILFRDNKVKTAHNSHKHTCLHIESHDIGSHVSGMPQVTQRQLHTIAVPLVPF